VDIIITIAQVLGLIFAFSLLNRLTSVFLKALIKLRNEDQAKSLISLRQNISLLLLLACAGLCILITIVNGIFIYQGKSVQEFQLNLIRSIPSEFWANLAIALAKSTILLLLVRFSIPILHKLLDRVCTFAKNYDHITANNESIEIFFDQIKVILTTSLWGFAAIFCTQFLNFPEIVSKCLYVALKAYIAVSIGRLLIKGVSVLVLKF
jgi:small conductance mechanosensitive channel